MRSAVCVAGLHRECSDAYSCDCRCHGETCACCEYSARKFGRSPQQYCCSYDYVCCDCHENKEVLARREMYRGVSDGVQHAAIGQD